MATKILLGPVLSFRGVSQGKWKVSALIGIDDHWEEIVSNLVDDYPDHAVFYRF